MLERVHKVLTRLHSERDVGKTPHAMAIIDNPYTHAGSDCDGLGNIEKQNATLEGQSI